MNYIKYTIHTTTEAEDMVSFILSEQGITSIEIEDLLPVDDEKQGGTFEELQPDRPEDDGKSYISFYLEEDDDASALLSAIQAELDDARSYMDIGEGTITKSTTAEEDWVNNWKEYFHSFKINNLVIKPTWEEVEIADDEICVEIDPGVSFGTGKHESTYLVIEKMQELLQPGDKVLDIGCGSGILSVIALKMGAASASGTDIDEDCITSTYDNMQVNGLDKSLGAFYTGDLTSDVDLAEKIGSDYDIVFANILADIIVGMAPNLPQFIKDNGYIITSGIIDFKEDEVRKALENVGLTIVSSCKMGEWRSITAQKVVK